jgi:hypothetical protein
LIDGTVPKSDAFGQGEPVARSPLPFDGLDLREGDEARCGEGGDGAGGSVLGDA